MFVYKTPNSPDEFNQYYQLRWQILRQPWQQPIGSERDELENCSYHRILLDDNNHTVAVVRCHKTSQHSAQVRYMAVAEQYQGSGLGQQLMDALEHEMATKGIQTITLNAREKAVNFYQKLGYKNNGFHHLLFNELKHFAMEKALPSPNDHQPERCHQLVDVWHRTIPMSKAMQLSIGYYNGDDILCHCDHNFNQNIHHTMFAGSIYTLATLTGWGWIYLQIEQNALQGDIVLADANIRYHKPITGQACASLSSVDVSGKLTPLSSNKKAKISLTCSIHCGDQRCATFSGLFIVLPKK